MNSENVLICILLRAEIFIENSRIEKEKLQLNFENLDYC